MRVRVVTQIGNTKIEENEIISGHGFVFTAEAALLCVPNENSRMLTAHNGSKSVTHLTHRRKN